MKTVNVVLIRDAVVDTIYSFIDNKRGNRLAEKKFLKVCGEQVMGFKNYSAEDKCVFLEDGYVEIGITGSVCICHSI